MKEAGSRAFNHFSLFPAFTRSAMKKLRKIQLRNVRGHTMHTAPLIFLAAKFTETPSRTWRNACSLILRYYPLCPPKKEAFPSPLLKQFKSFNVVPLNSQNEITPHIFKTLKARILRQEKNFWGKQRIIKTLFDFRGGDEGSIKGTFQNFNLGNLKDEGRADGRDVGR